MTDLTTLGCRGIPRRKVFSRLARMPRARAMAPVLCLAAALALSACGGEDAKLLPGDTAREITANLDTVQQLSDEGDCVGAESAARQVAEQIEAIEGVDRRLKQALEEGADRLEEVIAECEEENVETTAPPVVPSDEDEDADEEKEEEKEREEEEKEEDKAEKEAEREEGDGEDNSELPPQANGEGKGLDEGNGSPPAEEAPEEGSSGGVSPGAPAGGEDGD
jgi:hypothetical protein